MLFNHNLYGKCTLIPNHKHKPVDKMSDIRCISYVHLETGEIRESGINDAGIQTSICEDSYLFERELFREYGYLTEDITDFELIRES